MAGTTAMPKAAMAALVRRSMAKSASSLPGPGMGAQRDSAMMRAMRTRQAAIWYGWSSQKKPVRWAVRNQMAPPAKRQVQYWIVHRYQTTPVGVLCCFMCWPWWVEFGHSLFYTWG